VPRGGGGEDALAARLVALGATVIEAPSIAVAPPESWDELDAALREVETFAWIAFASGNAVDCTVARAAALGVPPGALARPRLAA
jgi:uroporphyrinogen III methyltransferase/synthase